MNEKQNTSRKPDMTWWINARYGMFIHWGLYAILGGEWKGKPYPGIAEWIMNRARIPVAEYEKLAVQFNPAEFSAEKIVNLAVDAGMKYLVITSKHHDGFALFKSKASSYNVVDATPFRRDIIGELAEECDRQKIRFGLYYSQAQDWHHPDAAGNVWDWPDEDKKDFQRYLDNLVYPQVDEILSNYGDISVLWFDTPRTISEQQSRELLTFVRQKQPDCIVNSRLGPGADSGWGDFVSLRDNEVPTLRLTEYGETCATINGTWGYSKADTNWKSSADILRTLSDVSAKNANYLLNIGPDALGQVPRRSVEVLKRAGKWLSMNGESIYNTRPTPFNENFEWGSATEKNGKIFLHLHDREMETVAFSGLGNKINKACFLDDPGNLLTVEQTPVSENREYFKTSIKLDQLVHSKLHRVLVIEYEGELTICPDIMQQPDQKIVLESLLAEDLADSKPLAPKIMQRGSVAASLEDSMTISWSFELLDPGKYKIAADCAVGRYTDFGGKKVVDTGHEISLSVNDTQLDAVITEEKRQSIRGNSHWESIISSVGTVSFSSPGKYRLELKVNKVNQGNGGGFILRNLTLAPAKQ